MRYKLAPQVSLLIGLIFFSSIQPANSATIAGTKCAKVGAIKSIGGIKYQCIKSGKKLIWNKGQKIATAMAPSKSASATPSQTPAQSTPSPSPSKSASPTQAVKTTYTLAMVKENNSAASCWSIINGNVYNLTSWIDKHPGGADAIKSLCGVDGTDAFMAQHHGAAPQMQRLAGFLLGPLAK